MEQAAFISGSFIFLVVQSGRNQTDWCLHIHQALICGSHEWMCFTLTIGNRFKFIYANIRYSSLTLQHQALAHTQTHRERSTSWCDIVNHFGDIEVPTTSYNGNIHTLTERIFLYNVVEKSIKVMWKTKIFWKELMTFLFRLWFNKWRQFVIIGTQSMDIYMAFVYGCQ